MKTKLLKRLRKEARKRYRIIPYDEDKWRIARKVSTSRESYWEPLKDDVYCCKTLEAAIERLRFIRDAEFKHLANRLIEERNYKRRFEQVKDL